MQQLLITGNLGRDPELRYTPNGIAVTSFTLADHRKFTAADGQTKEETLWFRVQCWARLAEVVSEFLTKGAHVLVLGELIADERGNPRIWMGQDGLAHASFEVRATRVEFLGRKLDDPGTRNDESPA